MSHHHENPRDGHTNLFVDLNGVPYLLAEYMDKRGLQQIDRSQIKSDIYIDLTESMRAIIDINIDDIGIRPGDNLPNVVSNNRKQMDLLKMINNHKENFHHQLPVLARGIVVRINYQLESSRTGNVIRSMAEDLRITNRNYYLDINPRDPDNNAIIVNLSNTAFSSVNEFTHGNERMNLRITSIQLFYECLGDSYKMPKMTQTQVHPDYPEMVPPPMSPNDYYYYHRDMQSHHFIGHPGDRPGEFGHEPPSMISPPTWTHFNRFYHFDSNGKDIVFHEQEVFDMMCARKLIPCGSVRVNRMFVINPGHRLIFKLSIWKNDVTIVNDCSRIAEVLNAPVYDYRFPHPDYHDHHHEHHDEHHHDHHSMHDYEEILYKYESAMKAMKNMNEQINAQMTENNIQSQMIEELKAEVKRLSDIVSGTQDKEQHPDDKPGNTEKDEPAPDEFKLEITTVLNETILADADFYKKFETNVPVGEEGNVTWDFDGNTPDGLILGNTTGELSGKNFETGTYKFDIKAKYQDQEATKSCVLDIVDFIID